MENAMPLLCFDGDRNRFVSDSARRYVFLLALVFAVPACHAAVCDPNAFRGVYGFSLTGNTTIGGPVRPVAVVGRLVLDDSGNLSGISSVSFTGLILGNGVTGEYEAHTDCSVTWSLQDDSGNLQHFAGTMSADGRRVAFRQTDPGGAENGTLARTMDACSDPSLAGIFNLTASGRTVDVDTAIDSGSISFEDLLIADGAGNLFFARESDAPPVSAGSYKVRSDCFVELVVKASEGGDETAPRHFRAILLEHGLEVQGIETDPGAIVTLRLVAETEK
jgi:hypothetical protein